MSLLRRHGWRIALVASGVTLLLGAPRHPEADAHDPLREELATMTAHAAWVPAHVFILLSTVLLAAGLVTAFRRDAWPLARRELGLAAVWVSLYVVEAAFHLAAVVDSDALANGETPLVATVHVVLSVLLYPPTGFAIAFLAFRQLRSWTGLRRLVGLPGVVAGTLHASSVPLTLLLPDVEMTPVFAGAGISLALWALSTGLAGAPRMATEAADPVPMRV